MSEVGIEVALGKQLQHARQKAGLTQQQLCNKANMSYSTLAKIERGAIKSPSIFTIECIADVLNVSLDELVGRSVDGSKGSKKVSKSGISFVYFDINGCLVRFFHRAFSALADDTGTPADIIESTMWHYNDAVCRGEMSIDDFNSKLAEITRQPSVDWLSYYLAAVDPIPAMQDLLIWTAENYRVGLVTNIMPGFLEALIKQGLIPDIDYDVIIDSSKENAVKPEKKIYQIAQDKAAVEPSQILYIDDSRGNLMAAEQLGWRVMWFDGYDTQESADRIKKALEFE